jgi:hypothetical protein
MESKMWTLKQKVIFFISLVGVIAVAALTLGVYSSATLNLGATTRYANVDTLVVPVTATFTGIFDISAALVETTPDVIIVGSAPTGVDSFPAYDNFRRKKRAFPSAALTPLIPTNYAAYMGDPSTFFPVTTINDGISLLRNKQVYNTTMLVHAGTYNENLLFSEFTTNCLFNTERNHDGTRQACTGLIVIGDTRRVVGKPFTHNATRVGTVPEEGDPGKIAILSCPTLSSVEVTLFDANLQPDFNGLYVVPGDIMTWYDPNDDTYVDKTITAVNGPILEFAEEGCIIFNGTSIVIQPNRIVKCQGAASSEFSTVHANKRSYETGLNCVKLSGNMAFHGFRVVAPDAGYIVDSMVSIDDGSVVTSGLVIDNSAGSTEYGLEVTGDVAPSTPTPFRDERNYLPGTSEYTSSRNTSSYTSPNGVTILKAEMVLRPLARAAFDNVYIFGSYVEMFRQSQLTVFSTFTLVNSVIDASAGFNSILDIGSINYFGSEAYTLWTARLSETMVFGDARFYFPPLQNAEPFNLGSLSSNVLLLGPLSVFNGCESLVYMTHGTTLEVQGVLIPITSNSFADSNNVIVTNLWTKGADTMTTNTANRGMTLHLLAGSGARTVTFSSALAGMLYTEHTFYATTAQAHVITFAGTATFDGSNGTATFDGAIGTAIRFLVVSSTRVLVTFTSGTITYS